MESKQETEDIPPGFELLHTLCGHTDAIWEITFSPDGRTLVSGSHDETIRLWNAESGDLQQTSKSYDKTVRLWRVDTGKYRDFREEPFYFVNLFDLLWRFFDLPFDHPLREDLRRSMSPSPR